MARRTPASAKTGIRHRTSQRIDAYLDELDGSCYLRDVRLAKVVQDALLYHDQQRHLLHAWVVMPNHVHTLFTSEPGETLTKIVHTRKSFTANECNKLLNRQGEFWQREPFDRYIRNDRHFENAVSHIELNPVKAGLCERSEDWPWGNAYYRMKGVGVLKDSVEE